jgi:hypothetical protein
MILGSLNKKQAVGQKKEKQTRSLVDVGIKI